MPFAKTDLAFISRCMKKNNILVVIVAYNSMKWIKRCYDSLRNSSIPCDVITIDNGSTDGTQQFLQDNYPEVELHISNKNLGFGKANNIGLQKALDEGYQFVYLLNQDAWVFPDTFSNLINTSQQQPEFGILSPMQLQADGVHFDNNFATNVIGQHQKSRPLLSEDLFFGRQEDVYNVTFVMAAHWLITRKCLEKVGGFSPTFFHYGEDDNYLLRAQYWKFKIGIVPKAQAVHDRQDSTWSNQKRLYINNYTIPLNRMSNPLSKQRIWPFIKENLRGAIRGRNLQLWNYALQFYKNRKQIEENYLQSLKPTAFLNSNNKQ